jgi:hypothetical protein
MSTSFQDTDRITPVIEEVTSTEENTVTSPGENTVSPPGEDTETPKTITVTPEAILLSAVEIAHSRGAYKMEEMNLINQAWMIMKEREKAREAPPS